MKPGARDSLRLPRGWKTPKNSGQTVTCCFPGTLAGSWIRSGDGTSDRGCSLPRWCETTVPHPRPRILPFLKARFSGLRCSHFVVRPSPSSTSRAFFIFPTYIRHLIPPPAPGNHHATCCLGRPQPSGSNTACLWALTYSTWRLHPQGSATS